MREPFFLTTKKMSTEIKKLHSEYPQAMGKLYVKYGLPKAKLSVQTTQDLATVYGDDFIYDLHRSTGFEGDSFFGGKLFKIFKKKEETEGATSEEGGAPKVKFMDKLRNFGSKAVGVYSAAQGAPQNMATNQTPVDPKNDGKILGLSKPLFYGIVAVGLILIVYALTRPKTAVA